MLKYTNKQTLNTWFFNYYQKRVKMVDCKILAGCFLAVFIVSLFGSLVMDKTGWYESIKPGITPPNYVFPIVWTALYILIAVAIYLVWVKTKKKDKVNVGILIGVNLIANGLWTYFFFGLKNPLLAFFDLIVIWFSIIGMLIWAYKTDRKAFYLLIPYFLWVSFAGILNFLAIQ